MAAANEIESMLVRLMGDGTSYQKMLKNAMESTIQTATAIVTAKQRIEGLTEGLHRFGQSALSAFAAFGVKNFLQNAYNMFVSTESILLKLKTAVDLNKMAVEPAIEAYKSFADEMFNVSGVSKDTTYELLRSAESMGRSGKWAMATARTAIQLATTLDSGQDPEKYIMVQQALETGNAAMLGRMQLLRGISDPYRKLAMVQDLVNKGEFTGKEYMKSTEGVMKMYTATLKGLTKQFGQYVAEAVKPTVEYMTRILKQFSDLHDSTKRIIVSISMFGAVLLGIGPALGLIGSMVGPVLGLFSAGWKMISGLVMGIVPAIMAVGSALASLGLPLILAIGAIAVAVGTLSALLIDYLGGIEATWEMVRDGIMEGWEYIKSSGMSTWSTLKDAFNTFVRWIDPAIQRLRKWFDIAFRTTQLVVMTTWRIAKQVTTAFIAWVTPMFHSIGNTIVRVWDLVSSKVEEVWDAAGQFISDFFDWVMPMVLAYIGVLSAVWEIVAAVAIRSFEGIGIIITWVLDNAGIAVEMFMKTFFWWWDYAEVKSTSTWTNIKNFVVETLIKAEFAVRNFGDLWGYMCASAALKFITMTNQVLYFFQDVLPTIMAWFGKNWQSMFANAAYNAQTIMTNLVNNLVKIFTSLPELIKGSVKLKDLWTDLGQGAIDVISEKLVIPERVLGDLERTMKEDVERMGSTLADSFAAFREKRLKEINNFKLELPPAIKRIVPESKKIGQEAGSVLTKAYKENDKLDAVLFRSAEAVSRILNNRDKLANKGNVGDKLDATLGRSAEGFNRANEARIKAGETTPYAKDAVPSATGGGSLPGDSVVVELLRRAADGIGLLAGKKPVVVKEAGL